MILLTLCEMAHPVSEEREPEDSFGMKLAMLRTTYADVPGISNH